MLRTVFQTVVALAWLLAPGAALAQAEIPGPRPKVEAATLAASWLVGRYRMPVICVREDGSQAELEEAVVIRMARAQGAVATLRATFFGIDAPEFIRCFNTVIPQLADRRGTLYLQLRGHRRSDLGMSDFRREMRDGEVKFQIERGQLRIRAIDADPSTAQTIRFDDGSSELVVRDIPSGSDGEKLLAAWQRDAAELGRQPRQVTFSIKGPNSFSYHGYYIEDTKRWK